MLFPERMAKASLIVHHSYVERLINALHEKGLMQIIDISREEPEILKGLERGERYPDAGICANYELRLSRLIEILRKFRVKRGIIKSLIKPVIPEKKPINYKSLEEIFEQAETLLEKIEIKIIEGEKQIASLDEEIKILESKIYDISHLVDVDIDLSYIGTSRYVVIKAGITKNIDTLRERLKDAEIWHKRFGKNKKEWYWVAVIAVHISDTEKLEKACKEIFREFDIEGLKGSPREVLKQLKKEKKDKQSEKNKIISELKKMAEINYWELLAIREAIQIERIRREIPRSFARTSYTYNIHGWVLERDKAELEKLAKSVTNNHAICEFRKPSSNPDEPPTHLELSRWVKPFKPLLALFGLPKYNEINPTAFMGFAFALMFGFMLGDAGYGLIILALSLFAYLKIGKHSPMIKNWSYVGILLGLFTTIFGFLFNSFFGDLVPRFFGSELYSVTIAGIHLPIDGLRNPLVILQIALILGLIHLNIGLALGFYQNYKRRNFKGILYDQVSYFLLQPFGGALIGKHLLKLWDLPNSFELICIGGVLIGLILLTLKAKGMAFMELMGFVGDWLSYARLLALGLATTGMALAFNIVGQLLGDLTHAVVTIIILILAHIVTLGLQSLGSAVHSLRLQYVEFFNRFYEGGGKPFRPFRVKRRYTISNRKEKYTST
jgi:V/A-type H+-transporting ATPase subunit I